MSGFGRGERWSQKVASRLRTRCRSSRSGFGDGWSENTRSHGSRASVVRWWERVSGKRSRLVRRQRGSWTRRQRSGSLELVQLKISHNPEQLAGFRIPLSRCLALMTVVVKLLTGVVRASIGMNHRLSERLTSLSHVTIKNVVEFRGRKLDLDDSGTIGRGITFLRVSVARNSFVVE